MDINAMQLDEECKHGTADAEPKLNKPKAKKI